MDVVAALSAYLLGSIPVAQLLVRWSARKDLSNSGSSNVGAMNALRVSKSLWVGIAVLVLDVLKGVASVLLARALGAHDGAGLLGVVAGHNYNVWLSLARRRLAGGKGFAAAAGGLLVSMPWVVAIWLGVTALAWLGFRTARGIRDEAPATAVATLLLMPAAYVLYGVEGAVVAMLLNLLIQPKLAREVHTFVFARPA